MYNILSSRDFPSDGNMASLVEKQWEMMVFLLENGAVPTGRELQFLFELE